MSTAPPVALVTGANRGLGRAICQDLAERGMTVLLGARDPEAGIMAAKRLGVATQEIDITDPTSIGAARDRIAGKYGRLDVLVNNAGAFGTAVVDGEFADIRHTVEVNLFGAWQTTVAFGGLLHASEHPRVVNVSSAVGSFGGGMTDPRFVPPACPVAKAALNAFTCRLAIAWPGVLVNAVCPGFVATFPGAGQHGARPVEQGAASVVWAATLPDDGPTGGLFRDGQPLPW